MFHEGDLQSGIAHAVQQSKAVLCFIFHDAVPKSKEWEEIILNDDEITASINANAIALRMQAGSQEAGFLSSFCLVNSVPAIIVIRNGALQTNLQADSLSSEQMKVQLLAVFQDASPPSEPVETSSSTPAQSSQPTAVDEPRRVTQMDNSGSQPTSSITQDEIMQQPISNHPSATIERPSGSSQRSEYVKMQKEREKKQRNERERIKEQIKADRLERRRIEEIRKQSVATAVVDEATNSTAEERASSVRLQVRTFDGSSLREVFPLTASVANEIRPWIDSSTNETVPYNLKIILTPLPNRNIEPAEEEQSLLDLGVKGSCTLVMVPVKGFVDSYTGSVPVGLVSSAIGGAYHIVAGVSGAVLGGARSLVGYGQPQPTPPSEPEAESPEPSATSVPTQVRVRTLADQRAEAAKKDQQFYNGNQLNFQPRKDDEKDD